MSTVSRRRATKPLAIATGALVLLFAALPTTTLLAVGMAPTLGRNTTDAVNSGVMHMAGALVDRCIEEAARRYGPALEAVITGGDAGKLLPVLRRSPRHDRDLVLKGISILAREALCGT